MYFTKGNQQIQITTENQIQFFRIDEESLLPKLDHVLYNFMGCTALMFGSQNSHCITYKAGQIGFNIYRRKYAHTFFALLDSASSYENSHSVSVNSVSQYLISQNN